MGLKNEAIYMTPDPGSGLNPGTNSRRTTPEFLLEEFDFRKIFFKLFNHKWFILSLIFLSGTAAQIYNFTTQPKYVSTALIQIGSQLGSANSMQQILGNIGISVISERQASPADIEIALIKSSYIMQSVMEKLMLNITVFPRYFPYIGGAIAKHHSPDTLAKPFLGLSQFAWGGEEIRLEKFETSGPNEGLKFRLQAKNQSQYALYFPDGKLILEGKVGKIAQTPRGYFPRIKLLITKLKANPGTQFNITLNYMDDVLKDLSQNISIIDLGNKDKTKTGVLKISFQGKDPNIIARILDSIIDFTIVRNIEKKSAEASKTLDFLNKQLPNVRTSLDNAETNLYEYRAKSGTIDMSQEAKIILMHLSALEQKIAELQVKKVEIMQDLKPKHPIVVAMKEKQLQLQEQENILRKKIKSLPKTDQTALSLERDVNVKTQLYLLLLSKIQQLQVLKAGTLSDIRILNHAAIPINPLPTHKTFVLFCGLMIGLFAGIVLVLVRDIFRRGINDIELVEERLGVATYAIVPYSNKQKQFHKQLKNHPFPPGHFVLAQIAPKDIAIEGIRSLRTMLQFSTKNANNNLISILGASPNIGKSFISINLTQVLVDSGKKVLLVDCDLRKGKLNQYLAQKKSPGMSELLANKKQFTEVVKPIVSHFDFIPSGEYPKNPSELLMSDQLQILLDYFVSCYDHVILDTPPILAVTDGVILAKHSATKLMIVGCGSEQLEELELMVKRLKKNGIEINGLVFNNKVQTEQLYGQYNYYYAYETQD